MLSILLKKKKNRAGIDSKSFLLGGFIRFPDGTRLDLDQNPHIPEDSEEEWEDTGSIMTLNTNLVDLDDPKQGVLKGVPSVPTPTNAAV